MEMVAATATRITLTADPTARRTRTYCPDGALLRGSWVTRQRCTPQWSHPEGVDVAHHRVALVA
jgi:hypothetical protein